LPLSGCKSSVSVGKKKEKTHFFEKNPKKTLLQKRISNQKTLLQKCF